MTKKDFVAIAAAIDHAGSFSSEAADTARTIAEMIADHAIQQNPRFDRRRFLKACGCD